MKRCLIPLLAILMIGIFASVAAAVNDDGLPPGKLKQKDAQLLQELQKKAQNSISRQDKKANQQLVKDIKKAEKIQQQADRKKAAQSFKLNQKIKERARQKPEVQRSFADVQQHWARQYIDRMVAAGVLYGYPDGTFQPDKPVTQAEIIALVIRVSDDADEDIDEEALEDEDLDGVPAWARLCVKKAALNKIINLNRFHSHVQASRAQAVVWIAKAIGLEPVDVSEVPFKDGILISREDLGYILAAVDAGIISGMPDGKFNPNSSITRAQIASIIERILNQQDGEGPGEDAYPIRISLKSEVTLEQGEALPLTAKVFYSDGSVDDKVTWSSDDTDLVTVSKTGKIQADEDLTGTAVITATAVKNDVEVTATCKVTVVEAEENIIEGTLKSTGRVKGNDGRIYEEYVLKVDGEVVSLSEDMAERITLDKEGSAPSILIPDSDTTLWFNIQKPSGDYTLTVEYHNGDIYMAILDWTAPREVVAEPTGRKGQNNGNIYEEYQIGSLDLSDFDQMYQIKPDGTVVELTANSDSNLWFKVNDQQEGIHSFFIKVGSRWYETSIDFSAE